MGRRTAMVLSPRLNPDVRRKTLDVRRAWPSGAAPFLRFTVCSLRGMAYPSFPCESQFPFGLSKTRFLVRAVVFGNACCFRLGREAKRNGGGFVGKFFSRSAVLRQIFQKTAKSKNIIYKKLLNHYQIKYVNN